MVHLTIVQLTNQQKRKIIKKPAKFGNKFKFMYAT